MSQQIGGSTSANEVEGTP